MKTYNRFRKIISIVLIIVFVFQADIFLASAKEILGIEIEGNFKDALDYYKKKKYNISETILKNFIRQLEESDNREKHIWKFYLLLGAVHEKNGEDKHAREQYQNVRNEFGIKKLKEINMNELPIYKDVMKPKPMPTPTPKPTIMEEFQKARDEFLNGHYEYAKATLLNLRDTIKKSKPGTTGNKILGQCYLLLGAIYEKLREIKEAKKNYKKACKIWKKSVGIKSKKGVIEKDKNIPAIEGIVFRNLKYYREYITKKCGKRTFPVLLVAAGIIAVAALVYFLLIKKPKKQTLSVTLGEGINGSPATGTHSYKKGETVSYSYTLLPGYNNLTVALDGNQVAASGSLTMDNDHVLTASVVANEVSFVTDTTEVTVPEGGTAEFRVKLSPQPAADVTVHVSHVSGDSDITVQDGSSLTFTTSNWGTYQTVTLAAADDEDRKNGIAVIRISASGIPDKDITAVENDNTPTALTLCDWDGYDFSEEKKINHRSGDFYYRWISDTERYLNSDYDGQRGIAISSKASSTPLNEVPIPPPADYVSQVSAQTGRIYVARDRNDNEYYIIFRIKRFSNKCIEIEWYYKKEN
ncbi:MAG: hypothetical protein KAW12_23470 [Candidatus Aminicenantes bacterium]|nr:hypothetical protein [Candidatus Aminicenantes bacterium]